MARQRLSRAADDAAVVLDRHEELVEVSVVNLAQALLGGVIRQLQDACFDLDGVALAQVEARLALSATEDWLPGRAAHEEGRKTPAAVEVAVVVEFLDLTGGPADELFEPGVVAGAALQLRAAQDAVIDVVALDALDLADADRQTGLAEVAFAGLDVHAALPG